MRTPSSRKRRLDLAPPLADRFILGFPIDCGPVLLLMPFGFPSRWTPCPPEYSKRWLQVGLGCIQLSLSCPFRPLHTSSLLRPARNYPRLRIQRPSSGRRRDFNPPEQCAAQRTLQTRPNPSRRPPTSRCHRLYGFPAPAISRRDEEGFSSCLA